MTPARRATTASRVKPASPVSPVGATDAVATEPAKASRLGWVRQAGIGVWVGLFVVLAGFGLIFYAWGKTAGELDVALQVPYLVSAGLTGLALILVGLLVVNLSVKRREVLDRSRQLEELIETMIRIRKAISGEED